MIESREKLGTGRERSRFAIACPLLLALCLTAGIAGSADAAKKGGKNKAFEESVTVNAAIPDVPVTGPSTVVKSTIKVGKKFKRKVVGDVNVTGIQTTGSADGALGDLNFKLSAPSGRSVYLITNFSNSLPGQNLGPLTLDDDTPVSVCFATPAVFCADPNQSLRAPFAGTANLRGLGTGNTGPLRAFNGLKIRGTWTLTVWDNDDTTTSVLNAWGLRIKPAKPVKE